MPIIRLTRQGTIGQCNCKVGGCRKCGSACCRCKCACDGISPLDALCRRVGKQKKKPQVMAVSLQDSKESSKKRKTQDNEVENTYTRKLRKRRKKISYNENRRGGDVTKDPSYIATKDSTDKVPTLGGGSISTKGGKTVIGTKEISNMRKIHDSQVDTSRTNSDASTQSDTITNDRSTTNMSDKVQNDRNSSLPHQTIGNLADIDNSARLLERNAPVNTELINNLVIRMSGELR